ncbi:MAG: ABC transporter permease [Candidatus Thorarchaeota archaeon]
MILKYTLQILALLCGSILALGLALILNLFGYENLLYGQIFFVCGVLLILIIVYELWKTREMNTPSIAKKVILWVIYNLKFIFLPGYNLDDLDKRRSQYELYKPKSRRIHRYKSVLFLIGIVIITLLSTVAVFQQWVSPYTYWEVTTYQGLNIHTEWFGNPSPEHPLGQTFLGFDILGRLIFGTRPIIVFTLTATLISCLIGILIGAIAGYYEGWLDALIMRIIDIILSFPSVIFALIFIVIWGKDYETLIFIFSIMGIPIFARLMRTNVIGEKVQPYITAGKVSGAKSFRLLFRHILPNCMQSIIVSASYTVGRNILGVAVLGFLRTGGISWIEWGYDISIVLRIQGRITYGPWAIGYPCLMILISVIGFLILGDSLSDIGLLKKEKL